MTLLKTKTTILPLWVLLIVPITAYAFTVNEDFIPTDGSLNGLIPDDSTVGYIDIAKIKSL